MRWNNTQIHGKRIGKKERKKTYHQLNYVEKWGKIKTRFQQIEAHFPQFGDWIGTGDSVLTKDHENIEPRHESTSPQFEHWLPLPFVLCSELRR